MRLATMVFACLPILASQPPNPPHLAFPRLAQAPAMTRDADLSTWGGALVLRDFGMIMPDDKGENRWPTLVHVGWGPDALYVAIEAMDPESAKIHAARHMRDTNTGDFDFVGVDLDPSGKGQTMIRFFVTPPGRPDRRDRLGQHRRERLVRPRLGFHGGAHAERLRGEDAHSL
ncbi:MAG TPA: hypothetical protein VF378_13175 [Geothrix sp.]